MTLILAYIWLEKLADYNESILYKNLVQRP